LRLLLAGIDNCAVQAEPVQTVQPQEHRWRALLSWRLLPTCYATGLAAVGAALLSAGNIAVSVVAVSVVNVLWAWVVYRVWRACVVLSSTSTGAGTVVVQGWLADRRVPVERITEVHESDGRYGPYICTIDGREIGFIPLTPPWPSRKAAAPQHEMAEALRRAARAAHAAHPEETAAAIKANAPLRTRRKLRRILGWAVFGLGILVLGMTVERSWVLACFGGFVLLVTLGSLGLAYLERRAPGGKGRHKRKLPDP